MQIVDRQQFLGQAGYASGIHRDPLDGRQKFGPHLVRIGPHGDLQLDFVGDDVVLKAPVNRTDRDHGRLLG